ncbi:MAG: hypothetical protein Q7J38_15190 [Gallionella sp.]|nr:hypothetical protein [Gallionella sp.]
MHKLKKLWHTISHLSLVVWLWDIALLSITPMVTFMTFMAAIGQGIPLAYVIAATVISLGGTVLCINQIGVFLGKPMVVRSSEDYSYGLGYEGVGIGFDEKNDDSTLQVSVKLGNVSRAPLRYKVERFDVVVGDRTIANANYVNQGGFLPLMGHREYRYPSFKKEAIKDFLGKRLDGSIEIHIIYGHPDHDFVRRMKMKIDISLRLDELPGISDIIREEIDEPVF